MKHRDKTLTAKRSSRARSMLRGDRTAISGPKASLFAENKPTRRPVAFRGHFRANTPPCRRAWIASSNEISATPTK
jgi:hypothetical protein